ncbi:MAG: MFS transporter [Pseudomonadales bacterium]|jgi:AAHS family 4-hydroxybenzoate transporter-like MFS transporter|nr:MFS transporter [Pseudomonadales bacterium]
MNANQHAIEPIDIGQIIDRASWSVPQKLAIVITTMAMVLDGFDNQILALSIPLWVKVWGVAREDFQWVQVVGYVGMATGAALFGVIGDRRGRRPVLMGCVLLFALPTLAIAFAKGLAPLYWLRFIGGMGLGGCMPNATALLAELTPARHRPLAVTSGIVGIPLGGTLGGFIAAGVMPEQWSSLYLIGGVAPLAVALLMLLLLPESPRYLAPRPQRREDFNKLMARFGIRLDPTAVFHHDSSANSPKASLGPGVLFAPALRRDTLALWGAMFFTLLSFFGVVNWLPAILDQAHYPPPMTGTGLMYFNLGGVVAALAGAACFNRIGSKVTLGVMALGAVVAALCLSVIAFDPSAGSTLLLLALTLQGACINGVQTTLWPLSAAVYPTDLRGAGIGWASGIGRLGAIISPLVGNQLLALAGPHGYFAGFALTMSLSLASILWLRNHIRGKH